MIMAWPSKHAPQIRSEVQNENQHISVHFVNVSVWHGPLGSTRRVVMTTYIHISGTTRAVRGSLSLLLLLLNTC